MHITKIPGTLVPSSSTPSTPGAPSGNGGASRGTSGDTTRGDQVQISDAGRALAANADDGGRVAEIMRKMATGAYSTPDGRVQIARAIIGSGDL